MRDDVADVEHPSRRNADAVAAIDQGVSMVARRPCPDGAVQKCRLSQTIPHCGETPGQRNAVFAEHPREALPLRVIGYGDRDVRAVILTGAREFEPLVDAGMVVVDWLRRR